MATDENIFRIVVQEAFEGATEHYKLEQRGLLNGDPDTLAGRELASLWARAHHLTRNSGWASRVKDKYRSTQGQIKVRWTNKKGKANTAMQDIWDNFCENPCLDNYGNMATLQDTWNAALFESGESLTRRYVKRRKGIIIPLALQPIESEYLDPLFTNNNDGKTKAGISFKDGAPDIYHFYKRFPGSGIGSNIERVPVAASDVIHQFIRQRPSQWRGIPKLASIILPLYEVDDLCDATVSKQKNAQAVAWIIKNTNPVAAAAMGTITSTSDPNDIDPDTGKPRRVTQSGAGGVQYLNKNEDLVPVQGADVGTAFEHLVKLELHRIACGAGFSYEELTGDLSGLSFSALKYVINEMRARAEFLYTTYTIPLGLAPLCGMVKEFAELYAPRTAAKAIATAVPSYRYPRRYNIDDLKDTQSDLLEIMSSLNTMENKLAERDLTFEDIEQDQLKRQQAKIVLPTAGQAVNIAPNSNSSSV